jgi:hypothetical protein
MNARRLIPVLSTALAVAAAGTVLTAAPALAAPPSTGCPAGYQLLSVQTLTAEGYKVPALIDSPTSGVVGEGPGTGQGWVGQPGKGDGFVCGVKLGNQLTPFGLPVYNFIDNQLPA